MLQESTTRCENDHEDEHCGLCGCDLTGEHFTDFCEECAEEIDGDFDDDRWDPVGETLRDRFAGQAMQGIMANPNTGRGKLNLDL